MWSKLRQWRQRRKLGYSPAYLAGINLTPREREHFRAVDELCNLAPADQLLALHMFLGFHCYCNTHADDLLECVRAHKTQPPKEHV